MKRLAELKARLETEELTVSERKAVLDTLVTEYEGYKALAKAQAGAKADAEVEDVTTSDEVGTTDTGTGVVETETTIEEVATVDEDTTMVDEVVTTETKTTETSSQDIVVPIHLVDMDKTTSKQVQPTNAEENSKSVTNTPTYSRVAKQLPNTNSSNSVTLTLLGTLLLALGITAYRRKEN